MSDQPSARLIHGRHPVLPHGGAAVDHTFATVADVDAVHPWVANATRIALAVGLEAPEVRVSGSHVTIGLSAPPDLRDLAADVLDQAVGNEPELPLVASPDLTLRALLYGAKSAHIPAFHDEDGLTAGVGVGGHTWPLTALPSPDRLVKQGAGSGRVAVPVVLVTGTNGKTTTAALLGAMATAQGHQAGVATSAGIRIGKDFIDRGDWSGPGAARRVARDPSVTFAVLETARGGLMRRGLILDPADVAILTNISDDHLGDWGLDTVEAVARAKLLVAEALRPGGILVTNGEDAVLEQSVASFLVGRPDIVWKRFSSRGSAAGFHGWADRVNLTVAELTVPLAEIPLTVGGAARHNVENALAAALAAHAAGVPLQAIRKALLTFGQAPADNPGRSNWFTVRGAKVLVDYAHNPDGFFRLGELVAAVPHRKRILLLGQAGDRTESLIRALGHAAAALKCDTYVIKPLPGYARGRDPQAVVALLREALREREVPDARIIEVPDELAGVDAVIAQLEPEDLALLLVHEDYDGAVARLTAATS